MEQWRECVRSLIACIDALNAQEARVAAFENEHAWGEHPLRGHSFGSATWAGPDWNTAKMNIQLPGLNAEFTFTALSDSETKFSWGYAGEDQQSVVAQTAINLELAHFPGSHLFKVVLDADLAEDYREGGWDQVFVEIQTKVSEALPEGYAKARERPIQQAGAPFTDRSVLQ